MFVYKGEIRWKFVDPIKIIEYYQNRWYQLFFNDIYKDANLVYIQWASHDYQL